MADAAKSVRHQQVEARQKAVADKAMRVERIRVLPANDEVRRLMRHPTGGRAFPTEGGSVEWPLDGFTKRRLADGSVIREDRPRNADPSPAPGEPAPAPAEPVPAPAPGEPSPAPSPPEPPQVPSSPPEPAPTEPVPAEPAPAPAPETQ